MAKGYIGSVDANAGKNDGHVGDKLMVLMHPCMLMLLVILLW